MIGSIHSKEKEMSSFFSIFICFNVKCLTIENCMAHHNFHTIIVVLDKCTYVRTLIEIKDVYEVTRMSAKKEKDTTL